MSRGGPPRWFGALVVFVGTTACLATSYLTAILPALPVLVVGVATMVYMILAGGSFAMMMAFMTTLFVRTGELFPFLAPLKPAKSFALLALGLFAFEKLLAGRLEIARYPQNRWMAILSVWALLSCFFGTNPDASLRMFTDVFVKILIVYVLILNVVDSERRCIQFQSVLVGLVSIIAVMVIQVRLAGTNLVEGTRAGLDGSSLGDPNDTALVLLLGIPFALMGVEYYRGGRRLLFLAASGLLVFGIACTQSRGGFLGLMAALALLYRGQIKKRPYLVPIVAVATLGLLILFGFASRSTMVSESGGMDQSAHSRLDAWQASIHMIVRNPLFGVGLDQSADNLVAYSAVWFADRLDTHNTFLKCGADIGIPGLMAFLAICRLAVNSATELERRSQTLPPGPSRALARAALPEVVGVFIAAFFLSHTWLWYIHILMAKIAVSERYCRGRLH